MSQGLFVALSGAKLQELKLENISNNLANANTSGYKKDVISARTFIFDLENAFDQISPVKYPEESIHLPAAKKGIYAESLFYGTDFSQGFLKNTENRLDIALDGPGFFAVETPFGERYTRQGSFSLNSDGELLTPDGYKVRGQGLNNLTNDNLEIDENGNVFVEGEPRGSIDIVEFANPALLQKEGHSLYALKTDKADEIAPNKTRVKQGFLEMPNIEVANEIVNLIQVQRMYEAYQKTMTTIDENTRNILRLLSA